MSGQTRAESVWLTVEVDEPTVRAVTDIAQRDGLSDTEVVMRAVHVYQMLGYARRRGERVWVGRAPLFAEEFAWEPGVGTGERS